MEGRARMIVCVVLFGVVLVITLVPLAVVAPPPIAMRTEGHALDQSGSPLPIGTPIHTFLDGVLAATSSLRVGLSSPSWLTSTGDALKLVYRNPRGGAATAGGRDIVVDRVEFNATRDGTLYWEPGNMILGDAPAPGPGQILERDAACTDTNDPRDFTLQIEPGLPPNGPPTVAIVVPAAGQQIPAATAVTFTWTMSDDVFVNDYLHVWANVTIGNEIIALVVNQTGVTSVSWTTRDITATDLVFRVDVQDPFGAHASASQT